MGVADAERRQSMYKSYYQALKHRSPGQEHTVRKKEGFVNMTKEQLIEHKIKLKKERLEKWLNT